MLQLGLLPYSLTPPVDSAHSFRRPILPELAARAKAFTGTGTVTVSHSHSHGSREPESQRARNTRAPASPISSRRMSVSKYRSQAIGRAEGPGNIDGRWLDAENNAALASSHEGDLAGPRSAFAHDRCRGGEHPVWRRYLAGDMVT